MVKRKEDEPEDKALKRLRQFEDQRKAVPADKEDNDKKGKDKKNKATKKDQNVSPDSATDQ
jgi:hypothetical protein